MDTNKPESIKYLESRLGQELPSVSKHSKK